MKRLTIVANIIAKTGKIDLVKSELEKLINITRVEEGCIQYDLHQDDKNPAHFLFYENWESRELWQKHMDNKHLKDFMTTTKDAIETLTINEMTRIA